MVVTALFKFQGQELQLEVSYKADMPRSVIRVRIYTDFNATLI